MLRDGRLLPRRLSLAADAVGMAICGTSLYVALSSSSLSLYDVTSLSRKSGIALPAPPLALTALEHPAGHLAAVALRNCSVIIYHGAVPVSRHETKARVLGLFGGALFLSFPRSSSLSLSSSLLLSLSLFLPLSRSLSRARSLSRTLFHPPSLFLFLSLSFSPTFEQLKMIAFICGRMQAHS